MQKKPQLLLLIESKQHLATYAFLCFLKLFVGHLQNCPHRVCGKSHLTDKLCSVVVQTYKHLFTVTCTLSHVFSLLCYLPAYQLPLLNCYSALLMVIHQVSPYHVQTVELGQAISELWTAVAAQTSF